MSKKKLEIEVEVDHGVWDTRTVKMPDEVFVKATNTPFQILKELGGNCMGVYMTILRHRNTKNNRCFPSIQCIMDEANLSRNTVTGCLTKLYEADYIVINSGYKGINSNYYFPQESFYELFEDDINQSMASRRKGKGNSFTEKRKTKVEKENEDLKLDNEQKDREIERLKNLLDENGLGDSNKKKFSFADGEDPF